MTPAAPDSSGTGRRARTTSLFLAFAGLGGTAATIPAVIPQLAQRAGLPLEDFLGVVPALFSGLLVGVLLSVVLIRAGSTERMLVAGSLLQGVGLATVAIGPPLEVIIAAAAIAGVGFGFNEASGSVLARSVAGTGTAGMLSALTGTVATAAALCPLLVAFGPAAISAQLLLVTVAIGHGAAAIVALAARRAAPLEVEPAPAAAPLRVVLSGLLLIALALFLYVGVETIFSGWSAVIPSTLLGVDPQTAALGTSVFWLLMAAGRYLTWFLLRAGARPVPHLAVNCAVAAVLLGVATATAESSPVLSSLAICATILSFAPCYSLILGIALTGLEVTRAARVTGALVACGAAGGSVVPALILLAAPDPTGSPVFVVAAVTMAAVLLLVAASTRSTHVGRRSEPAARVGSGGAGR